MGYYSSLLPVMTSAAAPAPFAVQANEQVASGLVYYALDKNPSTAWQANSLPANSWFKVDFGKEVKVSKYSITTNSPAVQAPTGFDLEASVSGLFTGEQVKLDIRAAQTWVDKGTLQFEINNTNKYRYYRVKFTAGAYSMNIAEIDFLVFLTNDKLLLSKGDKFISTNTKPTTQVIELDVADEDRYIRYGLDSLDFSPVFNEKKHLVATSSVLNTGKTYEHAIDMPKCQINKITLG